MTRKLSAASILAARSQGTTTAQRQLLEVFRSLRDSQGYAPTFREMADEIGVNVGDVSAKMWRLRRDGVVDWHDGKARTIRIVRDSWGS
jgi:SOS-response transcriptional repressor LexA